MLTSKSGCSPAGCTPLVDQYCPKSLCDQLGPKVTGRIKLRNKISKLLLPVCPVIKRSTLECKLCNGNAGYARRDPLVFNYAICGLASSS